MNSPDIKPDRLILFSLLAGLHLAALPLYVSIPVPVLLLLLVLSFWQYFIIDRHKKNPGRFILLLVISTVFLVILYSYGHLLGQQPGTALIILMTLLKLFETRTSRDCYIIIFSTLFIIASNFFHSQSIWLILYVFAVIIFLVSILIALSDRTHRLSAKTRYKMSAQFVIYSIPLMLILFLLFPRIPGPLWGLPDDAFSGQTGLSEEMSPGSINHLISSSAIAFRVKFDGNVPPHSQRYWRGAVLSLYDGKTWRRSDAPKNTTPNLRLSETNINHYRYSVTLEPTHLNWLLTLEYPVAHETTFRLNREAMLVSNQPLNNVISYNVESQTDATNLALFEQESYKNRLLPVGFNPETAVFARRQLEASNFDVETYIKAVLDYYTKNAFIYTLSPDLLRKNAMDDFLFRSRRGFCEHYASSFVYLMRAAGIPARVVIGYQGGKMNPLDDYMIVRQSDAHAWAEVWLENSWKRFDPTAAIAPERIEQGITNAGLETNRLPLLLISESDLLKNAAYLYDSFQNSWNQWVIGFNQKKQNRLLRFLGLDDTSTSHLIFLLVTCVTIVGTLIGWILLRQNSTGNDRIQHYYNLFCLKIERCGIKRQLNEGPLDFEQRILREARPAPRTRNDMTYIFNAYRTLHYGNSKSDSLIKNYIKKIKSFTIKKLN